jgi:hypothetical protein
MPPERSPLSSEVESSRHHLGWCKDACDFPTVLAGFAARHVNRGRAIPNERGGTFASWAFDLPP